jgi:hypothetical protein
MSINKFSPLDSLPKEEDIKKLVSNFEYKKIETSQLPQPIIDNGLVGKCNSFIVAASGNTDSMLYSFVGIRPDKGNAMEASGITANFAYKSIPPGSSGLLVDLSTNGMLNGLSKQFEILNKNKPK